MVSSNYWRHSSEAQYSLLFIFLFSILYEFLTILGSIEQRLMRIGPEIWFRNIFHSIGFTHLAISSLLMLIPVTLLLREITIKNKNIEIKILLFTIAEGFFWGFLLFLPLFLIFSLNKNLPNILSNNWQINLGLVLGAGVYEEIFFRFFSCGFIYWILRQLTQNRLWVFLFTVLFSSFFFSAAHFGNFNNNISES